MHARSSSTIKFMSLKQNLYLLLTSTLVSLNINAQSTSFAWVRSMGGSDWDRGKSITTDASGNVYSTGYFQYTTDFDPGTGVFNLTSAGSTDIYVQKLDPNGNLMWANRIGGNGNDQGFSIVIDKNGDVLVTGHFYDVVDFDPGPGVFYLTSNGWVDAFIIKLDSGTGDMIWVKQFGSTDTDRGLSITTDQNNNIFTVGSFEGTVDFDPNAGVFNITSSGVGENCFMQKLDNAGNFIWAKKIGGATTIIQAVAADSLGNAYCSGMNMGSAAGYIQKIDASGNILTTKLFNSTGITDVSALSTDAQLNLYVTGDYSGTVDFNPGMSSYVMTSQSNDNAFILKYDGSDNLVWARDMGGTGTSQGFGVATDSDGNVLTVGYFSYTVDFDCGPGIYDFSTYNNTYEYDIYIHKVDSSGNFVWAKRIGGTSYDTGQSIALDNNGNIYTCGDFLYTVDFDPGPGVTNAQSNGSRDIFIHKLSECEPTLITDTHVSCSEFTWLDGVTYTTSNNTAKWTIPGDQCDSIITLNLTILSDTTVDTQFSCGPFQWIDGNIYASSNDTAYWTLTSSAGCDSVILLDLTVINTDLSVTQLDEITLQCNEAGVSYQWLDCANGYAILSGESNQTFVATANGEYAVQVTNNGCTDTSACVLISEVGLSSENLLQNALLHPNPTRKAVTISLAQQFNDITVQILDIRGKEIRSFKTGNTDTIKVSLVDVEAGCYYILLSAKDQYKQLKVLKTN